MNNHELVKQGIIITIMVRMWCLVVGKTMSESSTQVLGAECTKTCGKVDIFYPFGVEEGCYLKLDGGIHQHFKINCTTITSSSPSSPSSGETVIAVNWNGDEVLSITVNPSEFVLKQDIAYTCFNNGDDDDEEAGTYHYQPKQSDAGEFTFSSTKNTLVVIGCDSSASVAGKRHTSDVLGRFDGGACTAVCTDLKDAINGECNGVGCCQSPPPSGLYSIEYIPLSFNNHSRVRSFNPCTSTLLIQKEAFRFTATNLSRNYFIDAPQNGVPAVVDWSIFTENCTSAKAQGRCLCKNNTICLEPKHIKGYICKCKQGFQGNPYHPQGCTVQTRHSHEYLEEDVDKCKIGDHNCEKAEYCVSGIGGDHHCHCPSGYSGKGTKVDPCISPNGDKCKFGDHNCEKAEYCVNGIGVYHCHCPSGYSGKGTKNDPCISPAANKCKSGDHNCEKAEYCVKANEDYHCHCPSGYSGKGTKTDPCISPKKEWKQPVIIATSGGGGIILLLGIAFIVYLKREKRKLKKMQESFFQQNGGQLLSQKLLGRDVGLKIFTTQDLVNATNNFNEKYIIGKGGFGIVYKGILLDDQHIAIKRSLKVDPKQIEQFINEIIILSQINNRNVLKLLGCCLETEVPFLVYEFITNGTLYEHLNDDVKASLLTWSTRLQIAIDVANVLSYLHKTISPPIIHRDMKSMNILLDENYIAKVADFGASRIVPTDQDHLETMVLGTLGYLDPEYMQTSELTEKSDVYSFGVVLVELLTRGKAVSNNRPEAEKFLAIQLNVKMTEGKLFSILDKSIIGEGTIEQIQLVADIANHCLMQKGESRPNMKDVATELENIKRKGVPSWSEEDGFFQEGVNVSLQERYQRYDSIGDTSNGVDVDLYDPRLYLTSRGGR